LASPKIIIDLYLLFVCRSSSIHLPSVSSTPVAGVRFVLEDSFVSRFLYWLLITGQ